MTCRPLVSVERKTSSARLADDSPTMREIIVTKKGSRDVLFVAVIYVGLRQR